MIRINLIPEGRRSSTSASSMQAWGIAYLLSGFALCVVLFLVHLNAASALDEQQAKNAVLKRRIETAKAQAGNLGVVEASLAKSRQLEDVANRLQNARQGPTRLLMELSHILSAGRGPTVDPERLEQLRRDNPLAGFNPGWDVRRLSLSGFKEEGGDCLMTGVGRTNEDVAELLRRLTLSDVFEGVELLNTTSEKDTKTQLTSVEFEIGCKVRY